ncbi:MAG TPA: hypothetical protein VFP32_03130, partial [Candidatus Saccharimonadales bacterium]|nr:hypothetical protein [Candidatus Saccharimonadales bacterium]
MRKQNRLRVVLAVVTLAATFLATHTVMAGSTLPWINSSLSIQKQADTQSLPDTVGSNGNIDCYRINEAICSVQTGYGQVGSGAVMMDYGNRFYPVVSYVNNTADNIFPIPNSTTAITVTNDLPYDGPHLYFNYNFSSIVELLVSPVNNKKSFIMQRPPDGRLEDLSHHRLATDLVSASFSQNGQWMVVSDPNVAMLRINLRTFEVLPFAPGFTYTSGYKPQVKTAITDDGRYAVVGVYGSTGFTIYDLNTCEAPPPAITNEVKCQWRDAGSYLKQQFPTFTATDSLRFMDDRTLAVYANYMVGVQRHTARFIIRAGNNSDYQQDYLALGDSYISGEGAFDYVGATDTATNKCHLSLLAYPYLIGHDLNYDSYHSVACAGATTDDLIN